jgi:hypothetical protein
VLFRSFPELADSFLCSSMIMESQEVFGLAAWESLQAAWSCDDAENNDKAVECRLRAADLFPKAIENNETIMEDAGGGTYEALLTDILRRAGEFDRAGEICQAGIDAGAEDFILDILNYELALIGDEDTSCHSVGDVVEPESSHEGHRSKTGIG